METGKRSGGFLPGKSLSAELSAAMKRVGARGVNYPVDYHRTLVEKYSKKGVRYPHTLMIIGKPRINHHFFYSRALRRGGRLLDFGCGTGDNVRQLIHDGFFREQITAFDINRESIDLGFDLYRDQEDLSDLVIVSEKFPFIPDAFNTVYSASVIHIIADEKEFRTYLSDAYSALRPGGIFFGSTLGLQEGAVRLSHTRGPQRIMTKEHLADALKGTGFGSPYIIRRDRVPGYVPESNNLCVFEFCTKKRES